MKKIISYIIYNFFRFLKLRNRVILFCFDGDFIGDNIFYIIEKLKTEKIDYKFVASKKFTGVEPCVKKYSIKFFLYYYSSKIIVTNTNIPTVCYKKKGQIYINTWHGAGGLKGYRNIDYNYNIFDYFLSESEFDSVNFRNSTAWNYKNEILKIGMPRNDIFYKKNIDFKEIKKKIGISNDVMVILYAPTMRECSKSIFIEDFSTIVKNFEKKFGKKAILLIRNHHYQYKFGDKIKCNDNALVSKCLKAGYSSIMYDGSHFSYIDNVNLTKQVVDLCHLFDVPVEGELGAIGGKSDATNIDLAYTKADTANDFVCKTSVDSLAVAIGTAHGIYKSTPKLDYQRCDEIRNCVDVPLVLHGASGLTFEQVRNCIESGICKVNYATELRIAYTKAVSEYCENHPENYDPKKYGVEAIENVKKVVLEKLKTVNSIGRSCKFAPKLIVIDFDGTIVDSEKIYQNAWIEASHYFNYDLNKNDALKLRSCDSSIAQQVFSSSELYQNIKKYRKKLMKDYGNSTFYELKNGIFEGLSFLKKKDIM